MIKADYHVHSSFSGDSEEAPEAQIRQAIRLGLDTICFTDHMDYEYPYPPEGYFEVDVPEYFACMAALKEKYKNEITVLTGIELGLRNEPEILDSVRERYNALVKDNPFDFVIGSTHQIVFVDPVYPEFWQGRTTREGMELYLGAGLDNIRNNDCFDSYGHLDYLIRYAPDGKNSYSWLDYSDLIDEMLKELTARGKALEINTKGLHRRFGLNAPNPCKDIIKRYREFGGELITFGSDAHEISDLAGQFAEAETIATSLGFRYYAVYEKRIVQMRKFS